MENKYYLAIEEKPNNYFPIDLRNLKIFHNRMTTSLEEIDALTLNFTKQEILEAIKEANLLDVQKTMPLVVIYYENKYTRKIEALTKEKKYDMWKLLDEKYQDKVFVNKIVNFLNHKIDDTKLEKLKVSRDKEEFLQVLGNLPYFMQRKLCFQLYRQYLLL